jgi:hypothetical protein
MATFNTEVWYEGLEEEKMSEEFRQELSNLKWYLIQFIVCTNIGHRYAQDLDDITLLRGYRICDRCMAKVEIVKV